ncbi:hypothetical protein XENTR_v10014174 [Xenopus tropicalis]|nr:hypothetical protein XENTR_v10014174 [Xenopus tropicalis]
MLCCGCFGLLISKSPLCRGNIFALIIFYTRMWSCWSFKHMAVKCSFGHACTICRFTSCSYLSSISVRTALLAIIGFMPTKGEGAIGSLDYTPEERKALAKRSQDYFCEVCGVNMKCTLLPLSSSSSQADVEARELARQISFKAEVNPPGSAQGAENPPNQSPETMEPNAHTHHETEAADASTSAGQETSPPTPSTNVSRSPRQRRAQQRRIPASTGLIQVQQHAVNGSNTGSAVLIVVLTLALAALIFRRIYLANDYIFDYEL